MKRSLPRLGNQHEFSRWFAIQIKGLATYRDLVPRIREAEQMNCFFQRMAASMAETNGEMLSHFDDLLDRLEDPMEFEDIADVTKREIVEEVKEETAQWMAAESGLLEYLQGHESFWSVENQQITSLEEVGPAIEDQPWIWKDWFPRGHLSLVAGHPGVGKTSLLAKLAGVYYSGGEWPDGSLYQHPRKNRPVAWIDTESGHGIVNDRCKRWGIDRAAFVWPKLEGAQSDFPDIKLDKEAWFNALDYTIRKENTDWVIVDTLRNSFRGDENSSDTQDYLARVARLAHDLLCNITFSTHFRKGFPLFDHEPEDVTLLEFIRGSSSIAAQVRSAMVLWAPNPQNPAWKRLQCVKNSFGVNPPKIGYEITDDDLVWTREYPMVPRKETALNRAEDWILQNIQPGEEIPTTEIKAKLKDTEEAPSWRAMERAKIKLKAEGVLVSKKLEFGGGWAWMRRED